MGWIKCFWLWGFTLPSCKTLRIACTCIFQMPIANIIPTNYPLTSLDRSLDKATVTMFHEEDLRLDIEDFKIAVVHNGTDRYVGTKPVQKNFKDGILAYSNYLQEVQVIDLLLQSTKDETVKSVISK